MAGPVRKHVWTAGRLVVLAGALLVTYGISFLTAVQIVTRVREVKVPNLHGQSVAEATDALEHIGLTVTIDPVRKADATIPYDHILSQDPDAGATLRRDRAVRLRVSDGQRDPVLPSVLGEPERTAQITMAQQQIAIAATIEIRTASYDVDSVVAQDPPAHGRSKAVTLLVNRGEAGRTFVMPDVIGAFGTRAAALLRSEGFRVAEAVPVQYPGLPPGVVVRQTPAAGLQVAPDELITLEVSR